MITDYVVVLCLALGLLACFFLGLGAHFSDIKENEEIQEPAMENIKQYPFYFAYLEHTKLKLMFYSIDAKAKDPMSLFEEEVGEEFNCLFYACEPIGRYYITAYNDEETGCKITASGTRCHEGTVTTCAADPKYLKFGEYLEIDGRLYVVEDTGSAVKKKHIDLFFDNYKDMAHYGSNYQTIYKVSFPFGKPSQR